MQTSLNCTWMLLKRWSCKFASRSAIYIWPHTLSQITGARRSVAMSEVVCLGTRCWVILENLIVRATLQVKKLATALLQCSQKPAMCPNPVQFNPHQPITRSSSNVHFDSSSPIYSQVSHLTVSLEISRAELYMNFSFPSSILHFPPISSFLFNRPNSARWIVACQIWSSLFKFLRAPFSSLCLVHILSSPLRFGIPVCAVPLIWGLIRSKSIVIYILNSGVLVVNTVINKAENV